MNNTTASQTSITDLEVPPNTELEAVPNPASQPPEEAPKPKIPRRALLLAGATAVVAHIADKVEWAAKQFRRIWDWFALGAEVIEVFQFVIRIISG